jgi:hypothetical protein
MRYSASEKLEIIRTVETSPLPVRLTLAQIGMTATLHRAQQACGLGQASVNWRPRLLSDNGSSYVAADLADWLEQHGMCPTLVVSPITP